jgi:hypothetical protein
MLGSFLGWILASFLGFNGFGRDVVVADHMLKTR